jgi:hypothetical protein
MATVNHTSALQTSYTRPVVPFPVAPATEPITQLELAALLSLRNRSRQLADQVEAAEKSIRTRLELGTEVELGEHSAQLKESFRRNVGWRDVAERLAERLYGEGRGEAYCENVLQNTKPSRSVSLAVV